MKKLIGANNGKIVKEEADGKKRMTYKIKGQEFAVYYYFTVALPPEAPGKLSSVLNITDEVIRYMLVRADAHRDEAKQAAEKAEKETANEEKGE